MTPAPPLSPEEYADIAIELLLDHPLASDEAVAAVIMYRDAVSDLMRDLGCSVRDILRVIVGGGELFTQRLNMLFTDHVRWMPNLPPKARPDNVRLLKGGKP